MAAQMMRRAAVVALLLMLSACSGTGFSQLNLSSPLEDGKEEKAEAREWDQFYGRKGLDRESKEWKDFYKAPNQDDTKPDYCGFWGNCAPENSKNPASCNFYGNCKAKDVNSGFW